MGKSGNPARRAEELKISQVGDFKKRLGGVMELPSGLVVKVRNPGGMAALMKSKLIPNSLMGVVQKSLDKGTGVAAEDIALNDKGELDQDMIDQMLDTVNNIALAVIVEPHFEPVPLDANDQAVPPGQRGPDEDDTLYIDELPDDDKMFIFQWLTGGTSDLETFRQRHEQGMASLAAESGARGNTR